jgi:hypothetical protein
MGSANTIGDFLRDIFSGKVNKEGEIFKALFANETQSGTVEKIFNEIEDCRSEWCNTSDPYRQEGEQLEKTMSYFSALERMRDESDEAYKKRNSILYRRGGDTVFGDRWNIRNVFREFFGTDAVFIVGNTDEYDSNLLSNGDFENETGWVLDGCSYDGGANFSGINGVLFPGSGDCRQDAAVDADSVYFLHFFLLGKIRVKITDNNGRFWKQPEAHSQEFGAWVSSEEYSGFSGEAWNNKNLFFVTDAAVTGVTVIFEGHEGNASLDYVRLFRKGPYPSFSVVVALGNSESENAIGMAPGHNDPVTVPAVDYSRMSYIEQSSVYGIIGGGQSAFIYKDLLEIIKPAGVAAYYEILLKA